MSRRGQMSQCCPRCCCGRCRNHGAEDGDGEREEAALTRRFHKGPPALHKVPGALSSPARGVRARRAMLRPPILQSPPCLPGASAEHFLAPLLSPCDRCSSHSAFSGGNKSLSRHTKARSRREAWV